MKISIIGYGKMGKTIEKMAKSKGHCIVYINNGEELDLQAIATSDVAIEFTQPQAALGNIKSILSLGIPVVSGTTGWLKQKEQADAAALKNNVGFLYASNFSLGVNLFFQMNEKLATLMSKHKTYTPRIHEIHHTSKKDAPSGTAIGSAEDIIRVHPEYSGWSQNDIEGKIKITEDRIDPYFGTHTVTYESDIDRISLEHHAKNREGFALGAVLASEWVIGKTGIFDMKDVLEF